MLRGLCHSSKVSLNQMDFPICRLGSSGADKPHRALNWVRGRGAASSRWAGIAAPTRFTLAAAREVRLVGVGPSRAGIRISSSSSTRAVVALRTRGHMGRPLPGVRARPTLLTRKTRSRLRVRLICPGGARHRLCKAGGGAVVTDRANEAFSRQG